MAIEWIKAGLPTVGGSRPSLITGSHFQTAGIARAHWRGNEPIRAIYRNAFAAAEPLYFHSHFFRDLLVQLGHRICTKPEEFKAWSQNIGDERVLTTLTS